MQMYKQLIPSFGINASLEIQTNYFHSFTRFISFIQIKSFIYTNIHQINLDIYQIQYKFKEKSYMSTILIFLFIITISFSKQIPIFNYSYQIPFDETVTYNNISYHTVGQMFYDPIKNRQRVDRINGQYNQFCGTILPYVVTPCTSLAIGGNRWQIFPARSQCCLCCTFQNGCGVLSPDWLNGGDYLGSQNIDGVKYDKWCKQGASTYDCLFVTINQETPRRLDESGVLILDYNLKQFKKTDFADSIFAVPSYCNIAKPTLCPQASLCGYLRSKSNSKSLLSQ